MADNYRPDGALLTSTSEEWFTPEQILAPMRVFAGLAAEPAFDPCGHPTNLVATTTVLQSKFENDPNATPAYPRTVIFGDGLALDWSGRGLVFCNPPYGRGIDRWLAKLATADEALALVPARTDTRWFHAHAWTADAILFVERRLHFSGADTPAPFPSALYYLAPKGKDITSDLDSFRACFGHLGKVLVQP
jgi:hypothetical protein